MIGNYILSGRYQAIASVTASTLVSLLFPPFSFLISGSVVALLFLRKGMLFGLQTIIGSVLVLQVFTFLAGLPWSMSLVYALVVWFPVSFASLTLRISEQQGLLVLAVGLLTTVLIAAMYIVIGDVTAWWQEWVRIMLERTVPPDQVARYQKVLGPVIPMVNAAMYTGFMINIVASVFGGRWWQARLFNQGAFRKEFYALRLPPVLLLISTLIMLLLFLVEEPWYGMLRDILIITIMMYLIQGISSVHRNVDRYKLSAAWLVPMYFLLLLMPQISLLIVFLGITDICVNWRERKPGKERIG